ncbi:MAG: N-acetylneuraminate synthase [Anaerolineae bacterium CG_4_9_14_3_um_filter_57_17]|nr:N-acetylneuraminate synthase [bacterium]NCT19775.1 N-acetylneuraminate synthase [bacterium]OIO84337.1 MAG: N-acetylneuraminate synthase [Anaerolineae bacterium CG2_30_57_67]PJB64396.1 MAG: N-acetylneuraminate synthase [Anaerolineae bacterium CG_4_9_14_3_um_filter_57_17]
MTREIKLGNKLVGDGQPAYIIAEIGINHNGDLEIAKEMIRAAAHAGADAVKFQKRTPEVCTPPEQQKQMRETPWGYISYLDYRYKVEFGLEQYREIDRTCKETGIDWLVSVWDEPSVDFMEQFATPAYKVPSASLTDLALLKYARKTGKPLIISTGMSTMDEIQRGVDAAGLENLLIMHCTSTYPCEPEELNLRMVETLRKEFPNTPIGYSGHEVGLVPSAVAVALGACAVERHFTLDRAMWGSDQAASVEPGGFEKLVKYIRVTEAGLGDGVKKVYASEMSSRKKLRRVKDAE